MPLFAGFVYKILFLFRFIKMQDVVSNVNNVKFDIEVALDQQLGAMPLPFPGMDSKYRVRHGQSPCKLLVCD